MEKRAWGENYIVNPFPYIEEDITTLSERDLKAMQKCFLFHYSKYEKFKTMGQRVKIPTYEERRIKIMQNNDAKENK